jgi:hypothetical protein
MTPKPAPSLSFSGMKKWPSYPEVKFFSKETTAWNHGIVKEANSKGDSVTIEFVPGGVVDGKKPSYTSLVPIESGRVVRKDTITPESFIIGYSISYEEVYPNGTKDKVVARLKSNGKFTCSSGSGYHMKAKRVDTMRGGETGPDKRYFTNCKDQDHHTGESEKKAREAEEVKSAMKSMAELDRQAAALRMQAAQKKLQVAEAKKKEAEAVKATKAAEAHRG